jgi:thiamine biosynthesis lipoprotein
MSAASLTSSFPAMSTTVDVVSVGIAGGRHHRAMAEILSEVDGWSQRFSRFLPASMISRVNQSAGQWIDVDEVFLDLLETARDAVFSTNGRFNPAVLPALEAYGYDRTIEEVHRGSPMVMSISASPAPLDAWTDVGIDLRRSRIRLPEGVRIDLGGIAKGALADHLADRFNQWPGGAISVGGDMRVWGMPPDGDAWRIGIEHPLDAQSDIAVVELPHESSAAVATSSRTKRAWERGNDSAHHLIDPMTGAPATTPLLAVTACAYSATVAEIVTKNVMLASAYGPPFPEMLLDAQWALTVSDTLALARIEKEAA